MTCEYSARHVYEGRAAVETIPHPVLGSVAICDGCRAFLQKIGAYASE
ncbi:hypothetical protein AB0O76_40515 [Streptomyces sp. NPDC086554]